MNLNIVGNHIEVTDALRQFIETKLEKITRHIDNVISVKITLSVDKLSQKAEVNLHISGKDFHVEQIEDDMYAAIELVMDKLDRVLLKHKEKSNDKIRKNNDVSENFKQEKIEE